MFEGLSDKLANAFKKFKNTTVYNPEIPLLGIYPKKTKPLIKNIYICTPMFIE